MAEQTAIKSVPTFGADIEAELVSGAHSIGKLYDFQGLMASAESCNSSRPAVFQDINVMASEPVKVGNQYYVYPQICELNNGQSLSEKDTIEQTSFRSFEKEISTRAGVRGRYGAFSGSLTMEYSQNVRTEKSTHFVSINVMCQYGTLRLANYRDLALIPEFDNALNSSEVPAKTLFNEWGTHIVAGVRLGGRASYMCSGSSQHYSSLQQFSTQAKAKYARVSGFAEFGISTEVNTSDVYSQTGLQILGGDPSLLNDQQWDDWVSTVADNPDWMAFTDKGLLPVWELCKDSTRRDTLEMEFTRLYTPRCYDPVWKDYSRPGDHGIQVGCFTVDPLEFVTGFGARINSKCHFTRCAVQFENAATGFREWRVDGDKNSFNPGDYERLVEVPEGCALTGLGLRELSNNLNRLVAYYQLITQVKDKFNQSVSALEPLVSHMHAPHSSGGGFEVVYEPENNNGKVIQGIKVSSSSRAKSVVALKLLQADFMLPISKKE